MPLTTENQFQQNAAQSTQRQGNEPQYRLFSGSYTELGPLLGLPELTGLKDEKRLIKEITPDLNRTTLYRNDGVIDTLTTEFQKQLTENNNNSYLQGDASGGVSVAYVIKYPVRQNPELLTNNLIKQISFAYLDDEGKYCGITIMSIQDPKSLEYHLMVSIVNNTVGTPENRILTFIASKQFLAKEHQQPHSNETNARDIATQTIPSTIKKAVKNDFIYLQIQPIFEQGRISQDNFDRLTETIYFKKIASSMPEQLTQNQQTSQYKTLHQTSQQIIAKIATVFQNPNTPPTKMKQLNNLLTDISQLVENPKSTNATDCLIRDIIPFLDPSDEKYAKIRQATANLVTTLCNDSQANPFLYYLLNDKHDKTNLSLTKINLYSQARELMIKIEKLSKDPKTTSDDKVHLTQLRDSLLEVVKDPTQNSHLEKLIKNAEPFSSDWSDAKNHGIIGGVALIGAIVLITCGCLGLAPTLGGSSLLIAAGIALIVFSGLNFTGAYEKGDQGLPKHVESFKNALQEIKQNNNNRNEEEEPLLTRENCLRHP